MFRCMFIAPPLLHTLNRFWRLGTFLVLVALVFASQVRAQDHNVVFSTSDPGVSKAVTNWGAGTVGEADVMKNMLIYMGAAQIDVVIMPFT
jgi:hypothetical protein